jgi:hypothetical protein
VTLAAVAAHLNIAAPWVRIFYCSPEREPWSHPKRCAGTGNKIMQTSQQPRTPISTV